MRKLRTHCKHGHKLTKETVKIVFHAKLGWTEQRCRICARNRERNRPKRRHSKGGVPSLLACSMDMVRTRRLLQLDEARERAATWWERQEILEQRRRVERGVG